jgi:hypothetical protein
VPTVEPAEVSERLRALESWGSARDWRGSDPYDGLNATRLVGPLQRRPMGRRVLTQLVKRSPLDLRPLLGIPPAHSSAGLAQVASGYALNGFLAADEARARLDHVLALLVAQRCAGFEEPCWGYHFDVQTRVFFYPRGDPNTIATAYAGFALLDAYEATGEEDRLDLAVGAGRFFLRHVPQTEDAPGAYFGYLVGDRTPIHNANMLVAGLLARLAGHTGDPEFRSSAEQAAVYTAERQSPDGSWPYGEPDGLEWVDGFHTGYVLESLLACARNGIDGLDAALDRGLDFYRRELFLPDGTAKYMNDELYPIDAQCVAQGIQTFALAAGRGGDMLDTALRIFDFARRRMARRDGSYVFQRRRWWKNPSPHVRWVAGPMLTGMAHLARALEEAR